MGGDPGGESRASVPSCPFPIVGRGWMLGEGDRKGRRRRGVIVDLPFFVSMIAQPSTLPTPPSRRRRRFSITRPIVRALVLVLEASISVSAGRGREDGRTDVTSRPCVDLPSPSFRSASTTTLSVFVPRLLLPPSSNPTSHANAPPSSFFVGRELNKTETPAERTDVRRPRQRARGRPGEGGV